MDSTTTLPSYEQGDHHGIGITWAAVLGGAVVVAALNLMLLALGAGLGISAVSPWNGLSGEADMIGGASIGWYIAMQVIAGSLGGFLAGRFRRKWRGVHGDEVYFRDTAHGFLAWGVAFLGTISMLAAASTVLVGGAAASSETADSNQGNTSSYFVDMLVRPMNPSLEAIPAPVRAEMGVIFAKGMAMGELSPADRSYMAQVLAARAGMDVATADQRVTTVFNEAKTAATAAKNAVGHGLLWVFLALLIGAFCASFSATMGGRMRDRVAFA